MNISKMVNELLKNKAIEAAVANADPAKTGIANPNPSVIPTEQAPSSNAANAQAPSSNVGDIYRRLTSLDVEEEKKKKGMKKGGVVKSSASKRADGIATKGKTRGKMV